MMAFSLLILACGNPSRGDDALGPALVNKLRAHGLPPGIEIVEDFQLQVEHALDMHGRDLVLFVDASASALAPFQVERLAPAQESAYTTHIMAPSAVLYTYREIHKAPPPPSFLLSIRGQDFALGQPLSAAAEANLAAAAEWAQAMCADAQAWLQKNSA
jgi:hydrogenase maturation protease